MNDFWNNNAVSSYILTELFDVDEIVRRFGGCPDDEDYKIERIYFYVEFRGADGHELIYVTEDEYKLHVELGDYNYRTDLNYHDFLNKFWFNEFQHFLIDTILPDVMSKFLDSAHAEVFKAEQTAKSQIIVQDILTKLIGVYEDLNRLAPHINKNKIQEYVIEQYQSSYSWAIKLLIQKYEVIFPVIIGRIKTTSEYFVHAKAIEKSEQEQSVLSNILKPDKNIPVDDQSIQYSHIFKNNAIEVWEYLKEKLNLDNTSRSDLKFIFEEMKKDGLLHKTVNQTFFLDWVNKAYNMEIQKTSNHHRTPYRLDRYQEALELYKPHKDS
jgi:hypothetical protein